MKNYFNTSSNNFFLNISVVSYDKETLVNNVYGNTEITSEAIMGDIKVVRFGEEEKVLIIPADKVVTTLVAISWQIGSNTTDGYRSKHYLIIKLLQVV